MNERANGKSGMNKRKGNDDENLSPIILEVWRRTLASISILPAYRLFLVSSFFSFLRFL